VPLEGDRHTPLSIFLKMDIEGAEYRTLPQIVLDAALINGIVIEFHDCDLLWERFAEIMALLDVHYAIAHIHGNNYSPLIAGTLVPRALEVTLVNRQLLDESTRTSSARYPIDGLDYPNNPSVPDYPLPL
jgi:hypothetical protein